MTKIAFTDWYDGFDIHNNFITKILDSNIEYRIIEDKKDMNEIDFVFCSMFGTDFLDYSCPRILYTGENNTPDFTLYDYGIGFDFLTFDDRYFRLPLYVTDYRDDFVNIDKTHEIKGVEAYNREFCSFVVSNNQYCDLFREKLFEELSKYKRVASGGRYCNNVGQANGIDDKHAFLRKYKFNIACENSSHKGYCTEKIVQAFSSDTIPIYWGDPCIEEYFNPKAFINCNKFEKIEDCIEYIVKIDQDQSAYIEMLNQPVIINGAYSLDYMEKGFNDWILHVLSQKGKNAYRRAFGGRTMYIESQLKNVRSNINTYKENEIRRLIKKMSKFLNRHLG